MKVTKKGEYGLKALLALAASHGRKRLSLREISEQERLPLKFLEQIMPVLKRTGFVQSEKGQQGGYVLARAPQEITLGEIIRAVDGPLAPLASAKEIKEKIKKEKNYPGLYSTLLDVRNATSEILDHKSLADICTESLELIRSRDECQMYDI